jgi:hypothetical protein
LLINAPRSRNRDPSVCRTTRRRTHRTINDAERLTVLERTDEQLNLLPT